MRIVIDGAPGSGKTTFISCNFLDPVRKRCSINTCNLSNLGYKVFTEMVEEAVIETKKINKFPPNTAERWDILFRLILNNGIKKFQEGADYKISWYDRGIPFLKTFAESNGQVLPQWIQDEICKYKYDYVFVFEPIKSFDLSKKDNGKFRTLTLEDRLYEHELTISSYKSLDNNVFSVPVFSDDLSVNFEKRYQFIKSIVPSLTIGG